MNGSLVTGASGFIGRRLVARLLADEEWVRALVLPGEEVRIGSEMLRGDVTGPESLGGAMRGMRTVYHLAAVVGDWGPEQAFQEVNVGGTRHVLEAAARAGVERVVVVSSVVVYGRQLHTDVCAEERPREPGVGPYSRSKRAQEDVALDYHRIGRVPVTVVRPGNVVGPGSVHWVETPVRLLRAGRGLLVDRGEGDAAFTWVDNLVELLVRAGRTPAAAGRIYNANDGNGVSWRQYFGDLARLVGADRPRVSVPAAAAMAAATAMEAAWRLARRRRRPPLTREAVTLLASRHPVPISRAVSELGFSPPIEYAHALDRLADSLQAGRT
jgi:nucleoside-diphosphate-sugar epimerase